MAIEELKNLERIGKLTLEPPSRIEFDGLLHSGTNRLTDAENSSLSIEGRFDLAYNAAHALSLCALRWHGYRSPNRFLVFQCLSSTLGLANEQWRVLDNAHRKRNLTEYEGVVDVDEGLVEAVIRVTREIEIKINNLGEPENGFLD